MEQVTEARRTGDVEKSKALLAEVFKFLGNSGYGKLIEDLERQTNVIYTKDEKVVDRALRRSGKRTGKRTGWKAESLGSQSDGRSRSESLSTSSQSFECLNFIITFLTGILTEETSS